MTHSFELGNHWNPLGTLPWVGMFLVPLSGQNLWLILVRVSNARRYITFVLKYCTYDKFRPSRIQICWRLGTPVHRSCRVEPMELTGGELDVIRVAAFHPRAHADRISPMADGLQLKSTRRVSCLYYRKPVSLSSMDASKVFRTQNVVRTPG